MSNSNLSPVLKNQLTEMYSIITCSNIRDKKQRLDTLNKKFQETTKIENNGLVKDFTFSADVIYASRTSVEYFDFDQDNQYWFVIPMSKRNFRSMALVTSPVTNVKTWCFSPNIKLIH